MPGNHQRLQRKGQNPSVHLALSALEKRLAVLEKAFDTNTRVFSDGMQMLEAQDAVARRVLQDVYNGRVRVSNLVRIANGHEVFAQIDFNGYLKEYIEELMEHEAKEEKSGPGAILAAIEDDGEDRPIIFGGDGT